MVSLATTSKSSATDQCCRPIGLNVQPSVAAHFARVSRIVLSSGLTLQALGGLGGGETGFTAVEVAVTATAPLDGLIVVAGAKVADFTGGADAATSLIGTDTAAFAAGAMFDCFGNAAIGAATGFTNESVPVADTEAGGLPGAGKIIGGETGFTGVLAAALGGVNEETTVGL